MFEALLVTLVILVIVGIPLTALVLAVIALVRTNRIAGRLAEKIERLEATLRRVSGPPAEPETGPEPSTIGAVEAEIVPTGEPGAAPPALAARERGDQGGAIQWELFIGRRALGWVAVALLFFAAAFFLKYAYENNWVGPLGRVAVGCVFGCGLMIGGWRYHLRGWRVFSPMLSAAGVVVLYLSTYSAFGFYRLLPRDIAGVFLAVIVVESAILAVRYDSLSVALTAVLGGLLTPLLMHSARDRYVELFTYLVALDLAVVLMMLARAWYGIGTVGLVGTQILFWTWYEGNYHPEKLAWALGFQAAIYVLFLAHTLGVHVLRPRRATGEDLARLVLNAMFGFLALYVLLNPDYGAWMGTAAVAMAVVYAAMARLMLAVHPDDTRQLLTALAVAVGLVALAFPLEADAAWIAVGWAAEAAALWWFGQRISAPALRAMAAVLAGLAVVRLLAVDVPTTTREPFVPLFNEFALPALVVLACLFIGIITTRRMIQRRTQVERIGVGLAGAGIVLVLWYVLSVECYGYFDAWAHVEGTDRQRWLWLGQTSLSVLWAVFAAAVLAAGFAVRRPGLRWLAMALFAVTVAKVFLVDMAELDEIYRIAAFLVAAVFLGAAAWAYQRITLELKSSDVGESTDVQSE